jgi:biopolymer transport protein ExbD
MNRAVPIAALQAALLCWIAWFVIVPRFQIATGVPLEIPQRSHLLECGDDRLIILRMDSNGSTWINETNVPWQELVQKMKLIMKSRDQKLLFLKVDGSLPTELVLSRLVDLRAGVPEMRLIPWLHRTNASYIEQYQALHCSDWR